MSRPASIAPSRIVARHASGQPAAGRRDPDEERVRARAAGHLERLLEAWRRSGCRPPGIHSATFASGDRRVEDGDDLVAAVADHAPGGLGVVRPELALGEDDEPARRRAGASVLRRVPATPAVTPDGCRPSAPKRERPRGADRGRWVVRLVPHTGFEPVISALRGRRPGPLDECGTRSTAGGPRPATRIPEGAETAARDGRRATGREPAASAHPRRSYRRCVSRNGADAVGDLAVALLGEDEAVVRARPRTARAPRRASSPSRSAVSAAGRCRRGRSR